MGAGVPVIVSALRERVRKLGLPPFAFHREVRAFWRRSQKEGCLTIRGEAELGNGRRASPTGRGRHDFPNYEGRNTNTHLIMEFSLIPTRSRFEVWIPFWIP